MREIARGNTISVSSATMPRPDVFQLKVNERATPTETFEGSAT
jgi:hypothetical protein